MEKLKKLLLLPAFLSVFLAAGCQTSQPLSQGQDMNYKLASEKIGDENVSIADAKVESFETLEELGAHADVIVRGVKDDAGLDKVQTTELGTLMHIQHDSPIRITKVYKGTVNKGDVITVAEPTGTYQGIVVSVEGYKAMKKGKEYILFLRKSPDENNMYGIVSVSEGKYTTDKTIESYHKEGELGYQRLAKFTNEANNKYK